MVEKNKQSNQGAAVEAKQAVVTGAAIKSGHLRVPGLRGGYRDVRFNDECVSEKPVSDQTAEALRADYPLLQIEEV